VASVLFEVAGLFLVALQLWRVQRRELGMPAWWLDLRGRLLRITGRSQTQVVEAGGAIAGGGRLTARAEVRRGPGETVDSRLAALEANFAALEQETRDRFHQQAQRQDRLQVMIGEAQAELQRQQDEREGERRERLRESTTTQWKGTALFFVGAVLAGIANGVC
jgi:hypothetical protein